MRNMFYTGLFGALCLSIFLPLDSETILQRWPYAPTIGFIGGYIIGFIGTIITNTFSKCCCRS
eukprot:UN02266